MILKEFVNWKLTHSDKVTSAEGYPLLMENCKTNKKMKQLEVYGNSIQNSAPSIENPIEVESVGELAANLFRDTEIPSTHTTKGLTVDYEGNGIYHLYGVYDGTTGRTEHVVNQPFDKNKRYVGYVKLLSGVLPGRITSYFGIGSETVERVNWLSVHATSDMQIGDINTTIAYSESTISKLEDATHISKFWFYMEPSTLPANSEIDVRIQIWVKEYGTSDEYEPYGKYKLPIVVRGKNFIDHSVAYANVYSEYSVLGTSYTIRGNVGTSSVSSNAGQLMFPVLSKKAESGIDVQKGKTYTLSFDYLLMEQGVYNDCIGLLIYGTSNAIRYQNQYIHGTIGETVSCNFSFTSGYDEKIAICFRINNNYVTLSNIRMEDADIEPVTQNVFIDEPLGLDRYIDFKGKKVYSLDGGEEVIDCSLPKLTNKTSVIEIDTTIAPSNIKGKYIKK